MGNALDNLRRSVVSIVNMLGDQTDTDIVANSLHNSMTTYKFFFMLYFLSDLFGKINQLSKSLQKRDLSYATVKQLVDSFLMAIEAEYLTELPSFGPLCTEFLKSTEQSDTFKTITFQRNHRDIHLKKRAVQCAQLIHDNIRDRFPDNKIFEAFSVFEPSNFPSSVADLPRYDVKYTLLTKHTYLIGRKNCDILIAGDAAVSRNHAQIELVHKETDIANPEKLPTVSLTDLSKFGTSVNGDKIKNTELKDGDLVTFGNSSTFTLVYEPFIISSSCLDPASKKKVREWICILGGHMVNDWKKECTLLVMNNVSVTIKVVCALLSLKNIVTPVYLEKSLHPERGKWKPFRS
ncbi:NBN [Mytilus edulis]|uniref:NBN n=1 Tax=Mytilus edulis TaxID=6550 RepID=A0A8S3SQP9_MYTED|nr:NBN [Mytilus edulis]